MKENNFMRESDISTKKRRRRQLGIRWKMLFIILTFIVLFTLVIWVFQIQMLNYFYQGIKYRELDTTTSMVGEVKDNNLKIVETVSRRAEETYDDVWIYKVDNGT